MMSRKFTTKELLLLLSLSIILLGIFYYLMVFKPVKEEVERCVSEQTMAEDQISYEQVRAAQKKQMLDKLEQTEGTLKGEICTYNNIKNEINELYAVLTMANEYNLSFSEAVATGTTVRRNITVSFTANSFDTAYNIIKSMNDSSYRCIVKDVSLSANDKNNENNQVPGLNASNAVSASVTITFYETTVGATDLSGLVVEKNQKQQQETEDAGDSSLSELFK